MKIIAFNKNGDTAVFWMKHGRHIHRIDYGKQTKFFSDSMEAAHCFGECIHHSLEAKGKLDWTDND
jgi:hypothetical protein